MKKLRMMLRVLVLGLLFSGGLSLVTSPALGGDQCAALGLGNKNARHAALQAALTAAIGVANGGLGNHMGAALLEQTIILY